ncbi:FtsW/RodA/SpoVE family cell cycle protein [Flavobacterium silvaticum]|uniref:Probable peptidoglycan glycosyltransferase FtsW n=1 Tax=Flavobacterium silvaticum TaxID=1852020 RepID=A0A972FK93_9FLAO|nr:FtsW/RodA/SpoVE family cell cycle protein [Flavobacterium silvaticum]NMH27526.1 FtsW/RodA/SpoVE family cell cycle protein [Flavobacterium silvaticum]
MKQLLYNLKGDKVIWAFVALLALFSFMPVFSASSNLAYANHGTGNTISFLIKHFAHIFIGFCMIYWVHKLPNTLIRGMIFVLPIAWALLLFTLLKGTTIGGANASRWIQIPFVGITFQPSTFAQLLLMVYVAHYLSRKRETPMTFKSSLFELWLPVFITVMLILPANFSTAALMFAMVIMLVFVGQYPLRYIGIIIGCGIAALALFVLIGKAFPEAKFFNRVHTWEARLDSFKATDKDEDTDDEHYQTNLSKIAIASGQVYGLGPGKSVQKNFLPQSSSDFIYAIIVEEYGLVGGLGVMFLYLLLFFRFIVAAHKATSRFAKLIVVGLGFPIVFQAMINMAVAVNLLPVTGQTLPLISSGGSSIWMTCIALGIIIGVTRKEEEIAQDLEDKQKRDEALQRMIDQQIKREEAAENALKEQELAVAGFSIEDRSNPMDAVRGKI